MLAECASISILTVFLRFILIEETLEVVISLKFIVYDIKMEGNGSRCILHVLITSTAVFYFPDRL